MPAPASPRRVWTAAEVRRLIEEQPLATPRLELVDGELLVTPSPGRMHQRIVFALAKIIDPYVALHRLGETCISPSDVDLAPELVVQPDIFVIPSVDGRRQASSLPITKLLLSVEVLSPGSMRHDRVTKRRAYQREAVPEYWIVDAPSQLVERWRPSDDRPEILDRKLEWHPATAPEPLIIDLPAFFESVADEQG